MPINVNVGVWKKAALSFLISLLLFVCFSIFAFTGLFDLIETRFYNPSLASYFYSDNTRTAESVDIFFTEMQARFSETLNTDTVRRSFLSNQSAEDIAARAGIYRALIESNDGLQWIRFIDAGGRRLHYSSYSPDIMNQDNQQPVYRNLNEFELSYEQIAVKEGENPKHFFDGSSERVLFSFPLYDSFDIYWGTAVFSLSMNAILNQLSSTGRIRIDQDVTLIQNPAGLLFGVSDAGKTALAYEVSSIWRTSGLATQKLVSPDSSYSLLLISNRTSQGFFIGRLLNEEFFLFPLSMKLILLASFFFSVYLLLFLLFNIRQDPISIVQNRLRGLQISLIEQYYEVKGNADWARWLYELDNRRKEVKSLLKRGVKARSSTENEDIDTLIKESWDELISTMGGRREIGIDEGKFSEILKSILEDRIITQTSFSQAFKTVDTEKAGLLSKAEAIVKELEETDEVEDMEELGESEELDVLEHKKAEEIADEELSTRLSSHISQDDIAKFASQIEFNPEIEPKSADEESDNAPMDEFLEIVSPFSDMLQDFSDNNEKKSPEESSYSLTIEESESRGLPLLAKPFYDKSSNISIETLEAYSGEDETKTKTPDLDIINEREGVPYVGKDARKGGPVQNHDFKKLVDSVIKSTTPP